MASLLSSLVASSAAAAEDSTAGVFASFFSTSSSTTTPCQHPLTAPAELKFADDDTQKSSLTVELARQASDGTAPTVAQDVQEPQECGGAPEAVGLDQEKQSDAFESNPEVVELRDSQHLIGPDASQSAQEPQDSQHLHAADTSPSVQEPQEGSLNAADMAQSVQDHSNTNPARSGQQQEEPQQLDATDTAQRTQEQKESKQALAADEVQSTQESREPHHLDITIVAQNVQAPQQEPTPLHAAAAAQSIPELKEPMCVGATNTQDTVQQSLQQPVAADTAMDEVEGSSGGFFIAAYDWMANVLVKPEEQLSTDETQSLQVDARHAPTDSNLSESEEKQSLLNIEDSSNPPQDEEPTSLSVDAEPEDGAIQDNIKNVVDEPSATPSGFLEMVTSYLTGGAADKAATDDIKSSSQALPANKTDNVKSSRTLSETGTLPETQERQHDAVAPLMTRGEDLGAKQEQETNATTTSGDTSLNECREPTEKPGFLQWAASSVIGFFWGGAAGEEGDRQGQANDKTHKLIDTQIESQQEEAQEVETNSSTPRVTRLPSMNRLCNSTGQPSAREVVPAMKSSDVVKAEKAIKKSEIVINATKTFSLVINKTKEFVWYIAHQLRCAMEKALPNDYVLTSSFPFVEKRQVPPPDNSLMGRIQRWLGVA